MFRLAGLLTGSAIAIALVLLVLGVPELPPAEEADSVPVERPQQVVEVTEPAPVAVPANPEPPAAPVETEPGPLAIEPTPVPVKWHAFWSPFGSRIAADGFVSRLESVTGFDYRVVKVDNGIFEVAFAYTTDGERDDRLATISSAAGLELPDS